MSQQFTAQQIADWQRYEKVRASGKHNMWFPGARLATGLSELRYSFVMEHYEELALAGQQTKQRKDNL